MRRSLVLVGLCLAFGGCSGASSGISEHAASVPSDVEGKGHLRIHVVSQELSPLAGAVASVAGEPAIVTGPDGSAEAWLEPGEHRLEVQALGYRPVARTVSIGAGDERDESFTLEALPIQTPYLEVLAFKGYSQCDYMVLVASGRLGPPCDTGQAKSQFKVLVHASWRFHVTEMVWKGGVGNYDSFRLFAADDGDCVNTSPCYGLVVGRGYARLEGEPNKTELVKFYDPWKDNRGPPYPENATFNMIVNGQWIGLFTDYINSIPGDPCQVVLKAATGTGYKPGCLGVGVSTGIPFDLYVSLFHWDGPADRGPCCPASKYSAQPDR
jgi:hypothetical protein